MDTLPDTQTKPIDESSSEFEENEALDPRVQIELERLNHANEAINQLELQLDEARKTLKEFSVLSEQELIQLENKIGTAVSKTKSYYDARIKLRDTKEILIKTKHRFERAQALHVAAKELAAVSIDRIDEAENSDETNAATWNETYRQAMAKAGDAEREKYQADIDQQRAERDYFNIEKLIATLEKEFRRSINKSRPYYEMKAAYYKELDFHKGKVCGLENCVNEAKSQYQQSLRNLEHISNEIHEQRNQGKVQKELGQRTSGADAEQLTNTETKQRKNSDSVLQSCLLRTESLSVGIITNTRYSPEDDETTKITDEYHDQFILRAKQPPQSIPITKSERELTSYIDNIRERLPSFSSQSSQMTDDDDNASSLRVLTDEQLVHLASEYHHYPSQLPTYSGTRDQSFKQSNNELPESFLY